MAKRTRSHNGAAGASFKEIQERGVQSEAQTITTTAIHIPKQTWTLLRAVAFYRAQNSGGRASVSKLITELVEHGRKELEGELRRPLNN